MAIAWAVCEHLIEARCLTLCVTHYQQLTVSDGVGVAIASTVALPGTNVPHILYAHTLAGAGVLVSCCQEHAHACFRRQWQHHIPVSLGARPCGATRLWCRCCQGDKCLLVVRSAHVAYTKAWWLLLQSALWHASSSCGRSLRHQGRACDATEG